MRDIKVKTRVGENLGVDKTERILHDYTALDSIAIHDQIGDSTTEDHLLLKKRTGHIQSAGETDNHSP